MSFLKPVISIAVEPKQNKDLEKLKESLQKLADEDPTVELKEDENTGQTLLAGMGELHLEILIDRLRREFGVEVNTGNPSVVFRETIRGTQTVSEVFEKSLDEEKKQNLYAKVTLTISPLPREAGRSYEDARTPENLELNPTSDREKEELRQGALEALEAGPVDGYPVQDVHIRLDTVEVRPGETTPIALRVAAGNAVRAALKEAQPVTLSPLMTLEVVAPEAISCANIHDVTPGWDLLGHHTVALVESLWHVQPAHGQLIEGRVPIDGALHRASRTSRAMA